MGLFVWFMMLMCRMKLYLLVGGGVIVNMGFLGVGMMGGWVCRLGMRESMVLYKVGILREVMWMGCGVGLEVYVVVLWRGFIVS